ncbi:MAG: hypothetical protein ACXQT5_05790 [Candidatus Syntropharchaeia archaeon]
MMKHDQKLNINLLSSMVIADTAENNLIELLKEFDINVGKSTVHYWVEKFKDGFDSERREKVKELVIARVAVDVRG